MTIDEWIERLKTAQSARAFSTTAASDREVEHAMKLSPQFGAFLHRHGAIRAFPRGRAIGLFVFASPKSSALDGKTLHEIANEDGSPRYLIEGSQAVYGVDAGEAWEVAADFATWLLDAMARLRASYSTKDWNAILNGAKPFTTKEREVLEARRRFEVTLEGIEPDERFRLRIHNGSDRKLPCLTYGVRGPDFIGALFLSVSELAPGETTTLRVHAYRDQVDPRELELHFDEPTPEDRADFRELSS